VLLVVVGEGWKEGRKEGKKEDESDGVWREKRGLRNGKVKSQKREEREARALFICREKKKKKDALNMGWRVCVACLVACLPSWFLLGSNSAAPFSIQMGCANRNKRGRRGAR
jgi:hypothetical protein